MYDAAPLALLGLIAAITLAACGGSGPKAGGRGERITFDASYCASGWTSPRPGVYDFSVANRSRRSGSATLFTFGSGVAVAQVSDLAPHTVGTVSAHLLAGAVYEWSCELPGATLMQSAVSTVPDGATAAAVPIPAAVSTVQLIQPLADYRLYVAARLATVRAQVSALRSRIAAGALAHARAAWLAAHLTWLEIGQDDGAYGAFGAVGGQIDGLAGGDVGGTSSPDFTGFHRVEVDLFARDDLHVAARDAGVLAGLLGQLTPRAVNADLPPTTAGVNAWVLRCHEILEDALRDTLTDADDYGSHTELASLTADVAATREMLRVLAGLIAPRAPQIVPAGRRELDSIDAAVAAAHAPGTPWQALAALPRRVRQRIDAAVGAAVETLAPVSELIQAQGSDT
jgi:iron uptake system EfeUOB component EfeO/EfeM